MKKYSFYNKIKNIINKYINIYNFIIGKKKYLKVKYNNKIYNYINNLLYLYKKYKINKRDIEENYNIFNNINNDNKFLLEIKNNIKKKKYKIKIIKQSIIYFINSINNINNINNNNNYNDSYAIIEIRSGTGGDEACLFVKDIYRMYIMYFKKKNINYEILNINRSNNGYREVILNVNKKGIYNYLKNESGVHRVQRIPKTETQGRLHTSAITVAVLPQLNDININIKSNDIKRFTFRSSGAGGQHVNKTESAVRLIHLPTNIIVECQEERSQHKNYNKAMKILKSKLYKFNYLKNKINIENKRKLLISTGDRSKKIRTYNYSQNRVTDHRKKLTLYNLDNIMNGEIDKLINNKKNKRFI
ncbi:PCRF domain-containing protein [Candidatus Shikimatogenerans bostrichidophilus]|uniref:PCRF domain-containing protein n=1 Tax=Candidatus Shikimatogenerans bostrichidophilus TaxID=2943807 RepID=UPI00296715B9